MVDRPLCPAVYWLRLEEASVHPTFCPAGQQQLQAQIRVASTVLGDRHEARKNTRGKKSHEPAGRRLCSAGGLAAALNAAVPTSRLGRGARRRCQSTRRAEAKNQQRGPHGGCDTGGQGAGATRGCRAGLL